MAINKINTTELYNIAEEVINKEYKNTEDEIKDLLIEIWVAGTNLLKDTSMKLTGLSFKAKINGISVFGKINEQEKNKIFLCQDQLSGSSANDKLGYKYSWVVDNIDQSSLHNAGILDFEIIGDENNLELRFENIKNKFNINQENEQMFMNVFIMGNNYNN